MQVKSLFVAAVCCSFLVSSMAYAQGAPCPKADAAMNEFKKLEGELKNPKLPPPEKQKLEAHLGDLKKAIDGEHMACDKMMKEKEMGMAKEKEAAMMKEKEMKMAKEKEMAMTKEKEIAAAKEKEMAAKKEAEMKMAKEKEMAMAKEVAAKKEAEMKMGKEKEMAMMKEKCGKEEMGMKTALEHAEMDLKKADGAKDAKMVAKFKMDIDHIHADMEKHKMACK